MSNEPRKNLRILLLAYVWPERTSSAAGLRTWNLIEAFQGESWEIHVASASASNSFRDELDQAGVKTQEVKLNDSSFDKWVAELAPDVVVFDRFVIEEQFGWRVQESCRQAIRILDTQDLHFLRRARRSAVEAGVSLEKVFRGEIALLAEDGLRELASVFRSDLTFLLSDFESGLLTEQFHVPDELLSVTRFFYPDPSSSGLSFDERRNFAMIGNFRHPPNRDGVFWFHEKIWPKIRMEIPEAEVHLYGAYPPKEIMALSDPASGFIVKGWIKDQFECLSGYRVNLAPLRFGAGIKGKISDGWMSGTPVVTTPIGAEGMRGDLPFGGSIGCDEEEFARKAVELYCKMDLWAVAQADAFRVIRELYSKEKVSEEITASIKEVAEHRDSRRARNVIGRMLELQQFRATKYFGRWLELKGSNPNSRATSG